MRILHVIEGVDVRLGGLSTLLASITSMERIIGIDNEVLSLECPEEYINQTIECPLRLFPASFPARLSNSDQAIEWLSTHIHEYDAVVINSTWNLLSQRAGAVANKKGIPYAFWPHNSLDPFDLEKKKLLKLLLGPLVIRQFVSNAAAICSSSKLESERLQLFGAELPKYVLPYPVRFDGEKGDRMSFRKRYGLSDGQFTFLFLSRVDYKKGLDLAIEAFATIAEEFPQARLIVAGPDTKGYSQKIIRLIRTLNMEDRVKLIGTVAGQDKSDAFAGADCFVLTSLNDSFGIALVEALQSGLPVLISDNVYIYEDVVRMKGGWVCQSEVESIKEAMKKIMADKGGYQLKLRNARKAGLYFSDLDRLKSIYGDFYDFLLNSASQ
ncbi:glycosyltransferase [Persicitalea sp.]|uniref:glycosyltransferase n=1 Tax=Persicitalea sp. TaxID=3100273 RepID=UPI0035943CF0